jgi:hypothetical protein
LINTEKKKQTKEKARNSLGAAVMTLVLIAMQE